MKDVNELINTQEKIDYLLDSIVSNPEKFNALPNRIQKILTPYKEKLERGESLSKEDYEKLKEEL